MKKIKWRNRNGECKSMGAECSMATLIIEGDFEQRLEEGKLALQISRGKAFQEEETASTRG